MKTVKRWLLPQSSASHINFSLTVYWRGNIVVTRWQILTHSLECNTQKGVIKEANWRSIERSWWKTGAKHANALNPIDFCCRSFGSSWLQLDVTLLKWLQRRLWVATRISLSSSVFGSADKLHLSSTEKVPINRATDKKLLSSVFSCKLHSKLPVHFWRNSGTGNWERMGIQCNLEGSTRSQSKSCRRIRMIWVGNQTE